MQRRFQLCSKWHMPGSCKHWNTTVSFNECYITSVSLLFCGSVVAKVKFRHKNNLIKARKVLKEHMEDKAWQVYIVVPPSEDYPDLTMSPGLVTVFPALTQRNTRGTETRVVFKPFQLIHMVNSLYICLGAQFVKSVVKTSWTFMQCVDIIQPVFCCILPCAALRRFFQKQAVWGRIV